MSITNPTKKYCNYKALLFLLEFSAVSSLLIISTGADAAEWVLTPTLRTDLIFTDNVRLAPENGRKEADFITRITPGIESSFTSRRFTSDTTYRLNNIIFARATDRSRSLHRLRSRNTAEIIRNFFYFDGNVSMRQQNQSILAPPGDTANITGNLRNIRQYKASPYIRKRLGNLATTELRYARVWNDSDASNSFFNSRTHVYNGSLLSGPAQDKFHWGLNYVRQDIEFDLRPDPVRIETEIANARYDLTRTFGLTATGGYEDNNFGTGFTSERRPKGARWSAGFIWVPNARTRVEASFGQRFFGDTYSFDVSYRRRQVAFTSRYNERIRSARNFLNVGEGSTVTVLTDLFTGQAPPGTDPAVIAQEVQLFIAELGLPPNIAFAQSFLTNRFFLQKRFESAIAFNARRNTLLFRVFHRTRRPLDRAALDLFGASFQQSNIRSHGGNITWSLRLSPLSRINVSGLWIRRSFPVLSRKDTFRIYTASITRQLTRKIFARLRYRRMDRVSSASSAGFIENRFIASLNMRF